MDGLQEQEVLSVWLMLKNLGEQKERLLSLCETEIDKIISHCILDPLIWK
jgi:hypothetical protein